MVGKDFLQSILIHDITFVVSQPDKNDLKDLGSFKSLSTADAATTSSITSSECKL